MNVCARLRLVVCVGLIARAAAAQSEGLEVMPGRMSGSHPGITTVYRHYQPGFPGFEGLQRYPAEFFQGIGDLTGTGRGKTAGPCEIQTIRVRYQDENGATSEGFELVARPAGTQAFTADPTKTLFTQSVPGAPATGTGPAGYLVTVQVMKGTNNSALPVPAQETFFVGAKLPAAPTWPAADGLSLAVSYFEPVALPLDTDWPKGGNGADPMAYVVAGTTGVMPVPRFSFGMALVPDAPVLQIGAVHEKGRSHHGADRGFGTAGLWPEVDPATPRGKASHDGLAIRIADARVTTTGSYLLFVAFRTLRDVSQPPLVLGGLSGAMYLAPPVVAAPSGTLQSKDHVVELAPSKTLPVSLLGFHLHLQALVTVGTEHHLTNVASVEFKR